MGAHSQIGIFACLVQIVFRAKFVSVLFKLFLRLCRHIMAVPYCESDDTVTIVAWFAIGTQFLSSSPQWYSEFETVMVATAESGNVPKRPKVAMYPRGQRAKLFPNISLGHILLFYLNFCHVIEASINLTHISWLNLKRGKSLHWQPFVGDYFYYCCGSLWKSVISGVIIEHTFLDSTWKEEQRVASCHWQPFVDSSIGWYFLIELEKRNRVATICWWCEVASHCGLWSAFASQQYKYTLLHCSQIHYVTIHKYTINYEYPTE